MFTLYTIHIIYIIDVYILHDTRSNAHETVSRGPLNEECVQPRAHKYFITTVVIEGKNQY